MRLCPKKIRALVGVLLIAALVPMFVVPLSADGTGKKGFTLVIDAGHGGKDPGAIGKTSREKDINLAVAKALGKLIGENCPDVEVIYTRSADVFIPLGRRAEIANKAGADLFISIHTNALPNKKIGRGAETYTLGMHRADENLEVAKRENSVILIEEDYKERYEGFDPKSAESYIIFELMQDVYMAQSVELARLIQYEFKTTAGRTDKGVHQAGFLVLRETSMPAVLVELGYISTPDEERFLNSQDGIKKMSQSIYNAFLSYKEQYGTMGQGGGTVVESERSEQVSSLAADASRPVFKVQILTSERRIAVDSKRFKALSPVECYEEGGCYKYTYGCTADYGKAIKLRDKIKKDFGGAFIVAFKDNVRMDLQEAIAEYNKE